LINWPPHRVSHQGNSVASPQNPEVSWAEIAQESGYFDQAHLDKDFLDLADANPTVFINGL
jgi:hypothetical protein